MQQTSMAARHCRGSLDMVWEHTKSFKGIYSELLEGECQFTNFLSCMKKLLQASVEQLLNNCSLYLNGILVTPKEMDFFHPSIFLLQRRLSVHSIFS